MTLVTPATSAFPRLGVRSQVPPLGLRRHRPFARPTVRFARVFAYDRPGAGQSGPATGERTYVAMMTELHDLLQHENIAPPYTFVGHSYGGALARVFYALYPLEVSGIVFVDPVHEVFVRNHNNAEREQRARQQEESLKRDQPSLLPEWEFLKKESNAGFPELAKYGAPNVPMALITATVGQPPLWRQSAMELYGAWIMKRDDSLLIVTPNSGHVVMRDEPYLVTTAIKAVLYPNPRIALMKARDAAAVTALYREQRARYPKDAIGPEVLNSIGYAFLRQQRPEDAIRIFALNVATFPANANAYDSLGEAYAAHGDRDLAIANYRKALELDPSNDNAKKMIAQLEAKQ